MHILVSNDDGYLAPGIRALVDALQPLAECTVFAPDRNRSGASNSLTLELPVRLSRADNGFWRVEGTPTDCVHLAITGVLDEEPDLVVSGINAGANMGDDVLYSGTVAAALEGRFLGLPAIALSMASHDPQHYATGAKVAAHLVRGMREQPLKANTVLNVNIPDLPWSQLRGFCATRLGHRHKAEAAVPMLDPRGKTVYWVGPAGGEQDAGEGTDFHAVREGWVSVTPLQADLTHHRLLGDVGGWLEGLA
jgi:5'-nucleotidase